MKSSILWRCNVLQALCFLLLVEGCIMNSPSVTTTAPRTPEIVSESVQLATPPNVTPESKVVDTSDDLPLRIEGGQNSTFVDPALGIQLDFPNDWRFDMRPDVNNNVSHFYSPCKKNSSPDITSPCSKVQVSLKKEVYQNFEELKEYLSTASYLYPLISREVYEMTIDGVSTLWVLDEDDINGTISKTLRVYILRKSGTILINGYGDLNPITKIVETMRLEDTE